MNDILNDDNSKFVANVCTLLHKYKRIYILLRMNMFGLIYFHPKISV